MATSPRMLAWLAAAALLAACPASPVGPVKPAATPKAPAKKPSGAPSAAPSAGASAQPTPGPRELALATPPPVVGTPRAQEAGWAAVAVTGSVRLLSNNGAGIISDNSGGLISDKGGSIISNNGGAIISDNSGGIISDNSGGLISDKGGAFRLQQAAPSAGVPLESLLADAWVEVLDAAGRILTDAAGKPLGAPTDRQGGFTLAAPLPAENLILRVRLFNGGELQAFLVRGVRSQDLDTASTLGATYVMREYVKGDPVVLGRLPAPEAAELTRDVEGARGLLGANPDYKPAAMADLTAGLRAKAPVVDGTLERIRAILLAGQSQLGEGEDATTVSLTQPQAVGEDAAGHVYVSERVAGRVRRIEADGKLTTVVGATVAGGVGIERLRDVAVAPDGTLAFTDVLLGRLVRRRPDGTLDEPFDVGSDVGARFERGTRLATAVAFGPDGTLWALVRVPLVAGGYMAELRRVAPGGPEEVVPLPGGRPWTADCDGLAVAPDGTLYAGMRLASGAADPKLGLFRRDVAGTWTLVAGGLVLDGLAAVPTGGAYASEPTKHRVVRIFPDGRVEAVLGTGTAGGDGDGGPGTAATIDQPRGLCLRQDGTLLVVDQGRNRVRALAPDGTVRTFAGAAAAGGSAARVALNGPTSVAVAPDGAVLVSEPDAALVRRIAGGQVTTFAGTVPGDAGDGGPAAAAKLGKPVGIAFDRDGRLWIADTNNDRIRRVGTDGTITTVVGGGTKRPDYGAPVPAAEARVIAPNNLAFDAQGRAYWTDTNYRQVFRLADGQVEPVAGKWAASPPAGMAAGPDADDVPARDAYFVAPTALAFTPDGALLIADAGGNRLRRLRADGMVDTYAGLPTVEFNTAFALTKTMSQWTGEGLQAREGNLFGVASVAVDAAGRVYFGELGTEGFASVPAIAALYGPAIPRFGGRIRRVDADGTVHTVAGFGAPGGLLNGTGVDDGLRHPAALAFDGAGGLVVADRTNNQVKLLPKGTF